MFMLTDMCLPLGGGEAELLTCPYSLKIQAHPPRDQRLSTQFRVSGREGEERVLLKC